MQPGYYLYAENAGFSIYLIEAHGARMLITYGNSISQVIENARYMLPVGATLALPLAVVLQ